MSPHPGPTLHTPWFHSFSSPFHPNPLYPNWSLFPTWDALPADLSLTLLIIHISAKMPPPQEALPEATSRNTAPSTPSCFLMLVSFLQDLHYYLETLWLIYLCGHLVIVLLLLLADKARVFPVVISILIPQHLELHLTQSRSSISVWPETARMRWSALNDWQRTSTQPKKSLLARGCSGPSLLSCHKIQRFLLFHFQRQP